MKNLLHLLTAVVGMEACSGGDDNSSKEKPFSPELLRSVNVMILDYIHLVAAETRPDNTFIAHKEDMSYEDWRYYGDTLSMHVKLMDRQMWKTSDDYYRYVLYKVVPVDDGDAVFREFRRNQLELGDTLYDRTTTSYYCFEDSRIALIDCIASIGVTCDRDIDDAHPAGSSLNDLFDVVYNDTRAVVENGYQTYRGPDALSNHGLERMGSVYAVRYSPLTALDLADRKYIGNELVLSSTLKYHPLVGATFHIVITTTDGRTVTTDCFCKDRYFYDQESWDNADDADYRDW